LASCRKIQNFTEFRVIMKSTVTIESSKNNNRLRLFFRPVALFLADTYDKGVVSNPPFDRR